VRRQHALAPDAPLIVYVGRLLPAKGLHELLAAMPAVRRAVPGATVVIAGEGPMEAELSQYSPAEAGAGRPTSAGGDGVLFLGLLDHAATLSLVAQADVFCLPSYSEGFSTVVLEAAALGTFVVTTPVGGSADLLADGGSGILLDDHEPNTIAAGLIAALSDPSERRVAARRAQERVETHFTWDNTAQALERAAGWR